MPDPSHYYVTSWPMACILLLPLVALLVAMYYLCYRGYVQRRGSEIPAIIIDKRTKMVSTGNHGRKSKRYVWDIEYVRKYIDSDNEANNIYFLYKVEYTITHTKSGYYWDKYDIGDCVFMKYIANSDLKNGSIEYHKGHELAELLNDDQCCFHCMYCPGVCITLGILIGVYYLQYSAFGQWMVIFMLINQIIAVLFLRYLCCPCFGLALNTSCAVINGCKNFSKGWKEYRDDPFWTNGDRFDKVITEEEYEQFILKMEEAMSRTNHLNSVKLEINDKKSKKHNKNIGNMLRKNKMGYLRLYHTDLYVTPNEFIVPIGDDFWGQSCFGGVVVLKSKSDSDITKWTIERHGYNKEILNDEYTIKTRINKSYQEYLEQFDTEWCHLFITGNMGLDASAGLHYHPNAVGYFQLIPGKIPNKNVVVDILKSILEDQQLFAVDIIIGYLDLTEYGMFQIQLVRSAADKMRIGYYLTVEIPKRETNTSFEINWDMNRANGPILDATQDKEKASYFVWEPAN